MSLARLPKSLRSAALALVLTAASVALHHSVSVHAMDFVKSQTIQPVYDISAPSRLEWNEAAALKFDGTVMSQVVNQSSLSVVVPWHPRMIKYSDLARIATIQEGRLEIVQHPSLGMRPVLVKRAALPEYIESISRETEFYRLLDGLGVTPLFLGHVGEDGVITGFVAEYVQEQHQHTGVERSRYRAVGTEACLSALRRMHGRGIAHRDAHGGNCLVREDGLAVLVDFELAEEIASVKEFERDLWVMRHTRYVQDAT